MARTAYLDEPLTPAEADVLQAVIVKIPELMVGTRAVLPRAQQSPSSLCWRPQPGQHPDVSFPIAVN